MDKKISNAVIHRLPIYYRYLEMLMNKKVERISSTDLGNEMGITASQVRQDLNCFGGFGQQGYGYHLATLKDMIAQILGIDRKWSIVIVGAGNIGSALAGYYASFSQIYQVQAVFDVDQSKIGKSIDGIEILDMALFDGYIAENHTDIAVLAVPEAFAQNLADRASGAGCKGIWNFTPMDVHAKEPAVVENIHLTDSLMVLTYSIKDIS